MQDIAFVTKFFVTGDAGSMGTITNVQQHQQTRTEEESTSCVGRVKLVR